jgi:translation elongation factor aEF-1 beta
MSTAAIQFKIMPTGLDIDLKVLKEKIQNVVESFESGVFSAAEERPIAFGLVALVITIALSESEDSDLVENKIAKIDEVSSVELLDYRRAVG